MTALSANTRTLDGPAGRTFRACPICGGPDLDYEFAVDGHPACSCRRCTLLFLNPQPAREAEASLRAPRAGDAAVPRDVHAVNSAARLNRLTRYASLQGGRLLLVGASPELVAEAEGRGFHVVTKTVPEVEAGRVSEVAPGSVDACLLFCALEQVSDPLAAVLDVRRALVPGGGLMVIAPTVDSRTARLFGTRWWEFRRENRFYFSADTLQNLLVQAGFGDPIISRDDTVVSLHYMSERLSAMGSSVRYHLLRLVLALAPGGVRHRAFRFLHSRTAVMVRSKPLTAPPRLSVIVAAYNESETFPTLMERLLAKELDGVDMEVIVVEGASTDGTREQALAYRDHPRVRLVLEDRPRGKGRAVRKGLELATGDLLLFQDADLEYDIDDYASLLEPLLRFERNFVIGSRHILKGEVWKVRQFNDAAGLAAVFNFGHLVFLTLFNLIYRQRLKDPFSMFKVFRRECLYGLRFECDRFDFDFEIVIKLLRKGYKAIELPVNYTARSFAAGKKVSLLRDPLTWLRALAKFRTCPLYPEGEA
jgi:hypothetical protein